MKSEAAELIQRRNGLATTAELLTVMTRQQLDVQVRKGGLVRVWRGVYSSTQPDLLMRLRALDILIGGHADDLAERIVQLGGTALGTVQTVAGTTSLAAYPLDAVSGAEHLTATADGLAAFGKSVRAAIDEATKLGDADTADLFTGISRAVDKDLWMVEAHLHDAA